MNTKPWIVMLAVCLVTALFAGCLDDKVLDVVITGETSADFPQNEITESWTEYAVLDVAAQVRGILSDNGYDESDMKSAHVTSMSYGVSSFSQSHDWNITGTILVARDGGPFVKILDYRSQSVQAALNKKIPATLQSGGVDVINGALEDFLTGSDPVLTFRIDNGATAPTPSGGDPMIFDWRAWLAIQIILKQEVTVPDPF